jgi:hypothetical protein
MEAILQMPWRHLPGFVTDRTTRSATGVAFTSVYSPIAFVRPSGVGLLHYHWDIKVGARVSSRESGSSIFYFNLPLQTNVL